MSVFPLGVWIYCVLASRLEIHQSLTHHLIHSPRSQGLSASLAPPPLITIPLKYIPFGWHQQQLYRNQQTYAQFLRSK